MSDKELVLMKVRSVLSKTVKGRGLKEREGLRNCSRLEKTEETWDLNASGFWMRS